MLTLADASQTPYAIALNLISYLNQEMEYVPWKAAITQLTDIYNHVLPTDTIKPFQIYARSLLKTPYDRIGWSNVNDEHLDQ